MKEQTYAVAATLTPEQKQKIEKSSPPYITEGEDVLSGVATWLLATLADGGMMLESSVVKRIEEMAGRIQSEETLLDLVEKGCGREQGSLAIVVRPDPVYEPLLKELGTTQDKTPQQIFQEIVDWVMGSGWAYQWRPEPLPLLFSQEDMSQLEEIIGKKEMTGKDVTEFVKSLAGIPTMEG